MRTIKELNTDIINITMRIHKYYPELSKYIKEIPVKGFTTDKDVNIDNLVDYYNSLAMMVKKYAITHVSRK